MLLFMHRWCIKKLLCQARIWEKLNKFAPPWLSISSNKPCCRLLLNLKKAPLVLIRGFTVNKTYYMTCVVACKLNPVKLLVLFIETLYNDNGPSIFFLTRYKHPKWLMPYLWIMLGQLVMYQKTQRVCLKTSAPFKITLTSTLPLLCFSRKILFCLFVFGFASQLTLWKQCIFLS